jgi:hypothetical protein
MPVDPPLHPLNLIEVFGSEFLAVNLFLGAARFLAANLILPGRGEDQVDVIVQVAGLERLPFILVEPDSAAVAALIEREVGPVADSALVTGLGGIVCPSDVSGRPALCCSRHFQYSNDGIQLPPHLSQWREIRLLSSGEKSNSSVLHAGHFIVAASAESEHTDCSRAAQTALQCAQWRRLLPKRSSWNRVVSASTRSA